jgi:drug/metabolite transporter (DMT)-like permease
MRSLLERYWMLNPVGEALFRVLSKWCQKFIGLASAAPGVIFFVVFIRGFIQVIVGAVTAKQIFVEWPIVWRCMMFGAGSVAASVCSIAAFQAGGPVVVVVFISSLALFPGALFDRIFFGVKLSMRQWLGIGVAISAFFLVRDWSGIESTSFASVPLWTWWAVGNMVSVAANQAVSKSISRYSKGESVKFVKSFWGGLASVAIATPLFFVFDSYSQAIVYALTPMLVIVSVTIGLILVAMWYFNLKGYDKKPTMALKQLIATGSVIVFGIIAGLWYGEFPTLNMLFGIMLLGLAIVLIDNEAWAYVREKTPQTIPELHAPRFRPYVHGTNPAILEGVARS